MNATCWSGTSNPLADENPGCYQNVSIARPLGPPDLNLLRQVAAVKPGELSPQSHVETTPPPTPNRVSTCGHVPLVGVSSHADVGDLPMSMSMS